MSTIRKSETKKKLPRTRRACIPCHKAKVSCERDRPCRRCRDRDCESECIDHIGSRRNRGNAAKAAPVASDSSMTLACSTPSAKGPFSVDGKPCESNQLFGILFNSFQQQLKTNGVLPTPTTVSLAIGHWGPHLKQSQINVLCDYLASYGDESYVMSMHNIKHMPPIRRAQLTDRVPISYPVETQPPLLYSAPQLDFMPLPVLYNIFDPAAHVYYMHLNSALIRYLEYEETDKKAMLNATRCAPLLLDPSARNRFLQQISVNLLAGHPRFSFSTILLTKSKVKKHVKFSASVQFFSSGKGRAMLCVFMPIEHPLDMTDTTPVPGEIPKPTPSHTAPSTAGSMRMPDTPGYSTSSTDNISEGSSTPLHQTFGEGLSFSRGTSTGVGSHATASGWHNGDNISSTSEAETPPLSDSFPFPDLFDGIGLFSPLIPMGAEFDLDINSVEF
eukprot:GILK01009753.1.p1 GENE.GILK01009753.1~~GILK01009753.1.p1  ORF type:complete len:457 (+),score=59.33 GILK01009753.1:38-1372(+)